jgi:pimeloyl-ACP methyl ester carboxylesterase
MTKGVSMCRRLFDLLAGFAIAAVLALGAAHAATAPKLFADSTVVERDRFSDEIVGSGPDLVFIPGLASSRETWKAEAERLRTHYRLHLIQVAGFAGEPARANGSGAVLVPTAEAIDAYLVEQHLTPAVAIGHSMGGTMLLYLAEHHGDHFKKILIVDALPFFAVAMMGPAATVEMVKPFADRARASATPPPNREQMIAGMVTSDANRAMVSGWGAASDGATVNNAFADDIELDLRPGLASIPVPITLLYPDNAPGGANPATMDALYQGAFAPVPRKTLIRIDGSRHFIMLDQPAQLEAALDGFLKD